MLIGTNNSDDRNFKKTHNPEEIYRGTKAIVNLIKKTYPEIKILVLRIFPRGGDDEKGISPPVFKSSEKCINICHEAGLLTKQLVDGKQVYWMDINKIFLLENGKIDTKKMWDLLHPSPSGAEAWAIAVSPTLLKLINKNKTKVNIDIDKYPVRRSNPILKGSYGLPEDTERYVVKGQGLIGIELDKGDNLILKKIFR